MVTTGYQYLINSATVQLEDIKILKNIAQF